MKMSLEWYMVWLQVRMDIEFVNIVTMRLNYMLKIWTLRFLCSIVNIRIWDGLCDHLDLL
jgi:hypothetical protein